MSRSSPGSPPLARSHPDVQPSDSAARTIAVPRAPEMPRPHGIPIVATLAPVIGSVLIWALTRSPFALVFALLGPLVAVASMADDRLQARRTRRTENARFDRELENTRRSIDKSHADERRQLHRSAPGALELAAMAPHDPERWRLLPADGVPIRLGLGRATSTVRLEGLSAARPVADGPIESEFERLRMRSATIGGVPIVVDSRLGIGVCGPPTVSAAVLRGLLLQLAGQLSPRTVVFTPWGDGARNWIAELPQRTSDPVDPAIVGAPAGVSSAAAGVSWEGQGEAGMVSMAARIEDLPRDCRVVVQVGAGRVARVVRCPDGAGIDGLPLDITPEFISAEQAAELGRLLGIAMAVRGLDPLESAGAGDGDFESLPLPTASPSAPATLAGVFSRSTTGPFPLDLVAQGPHAVVGGTTGSGKSDLLVSWVLAIARAHPPSAVNFLLVDFKGGASFAPIRSLPHVVGVVTDLDERTAHRAMLSLRAELRVRERILAAAGARSIDDPRVDLPRLVIVVDEFAAMASDYPELHELFADLAARGRSLGLHLVLCTQRPAGAIRDAVLANATLRISLRVNNPADSIAVIGTAQAARLPADEPGRAWVTAGGDPARLIRVARVTEGDVSRVRDSHPQPEGGSRRPWCDDLPPLVPLASLVSSEIGDGGIPFARVDLPGEQRQETARLVPEDAGNLVVIGAQGSGKTELFRTLGAAHGVELLPAEFDEAWDHVDALVDRVRSGSTGSRLLLADDLDALVGRLPEDYQQAFIDRLVELARDGSTVGLQLAISVRRIPPALQTLVSLCDSRIVLRLGSRQDHLLAGGTAVGYSTDAVPGSGEWRGSRIQVALRAPSDSAPPRPSPEVAGPRDFTRHPSVAVVTTRPTEFAALLRAQEPWLTDLRELTGRGPTTSDPAAPGRLAVVDARGPSVIVGDPDAWQANWALLGAARSRGLVVIDRCSVADFRAISGRRILPPPVRPGSRQCWALEADGSVHRMMAPAARDS